MVPLKRSNSYASLEEKETQINMLAARGLTVGVIFWELYHVFFFSPYEPGTVSTKSIQIYPSKMIIFFPRMKPASQAGGRHMPRHQ